MLFRDGALGEVVNTLVCGTSMQEFDPLRTPHFKYKRNLIKVPFYVIMYVARNLA